MKFFFYKWKFFLIFLVMVMICISCGSKNLKNNLFTVTEVIDGNTIKLLNGYKVNLIGVRDTKESKEYLKDQLVKRRVKFEFDSYCPSYQIRGNAKNNSFYAYVISERGPCVNSEIIRNGYSRINYDTPYLNDSLDKYSRMRKRYASNNDSDRKKENTASTSNNNSDQKKDAEEQENGSEPFTGIVNTNKGPENMLQKLISVCDYNNSITRDFAVKQAGQSSGKYNVNQVIDIYDAIRPPNWNYVNDPKSNEYFSKASHTIKKTNLTGDCDDFAILMYSLIMSIGGEARITLAWNNKRGHAFTEVNIQDIGITKVKNVIRRRFSGYQIDKLHYRKDSKGTWLNLDWWAEYPGGKYMNYNQEIIFYPAQDHYQANVSM